MLRVTIDVCPYGDESQARMISQMKLGNVNTVGDIADYVVIIEDEEVAKVEGHERSKGPWELVSRAVNQLDENQKKGLPSLRKQALDFMEFKELLDGDSGKRKSGHADLSIPTDLLDQVVLFLSSVLQRGPHSILDLHQIKNEINYNLDLRNDWTLSQIDPTRTYYRLGARYDSQDTVDSLMDVLLWRFSGEVNRLD